MSINIVEDKGLCNIKRNNLSNQFILEYLNNKYENHIINTNRGTIQIFSNEYVVSVLQDTSNEPSNKRLQGSAINAANNKKCDLLGVYPIFSYSNAELISSLIFVHWKNRDIPKNKKNPSVKIKVEEIYDSYSRNSALLSKKNLYPAEIIPELLFMNEEFGDLIKRRNKTSYMIEKDSTNLKNDLEKNSVELLNIQPNASILNVFSRLSYKPWYALAEFVDNSTQSFLSNKDELMRSGNDFKLKIEIDYDEGSRVLTIADNAFGMEHEQFKNAILLDSKNESQVGRNEFGMGLKTAASWFGNIWSVRSTQYRSENEYFAKINIPQLQKTEENLTEIVKRKVSSKKHGTIIKIEEVTKPIVGGRTIGKIKDLLSSMYRRDLKSEIVEIWFNGVPISFEEYPILEDYKKKNWRKYLNFSFDFEGFTHNVTGFVAIMNPGSFGKSGFSLFRHNRVVIGGLDQNYKPIEIFGQAQSQISLKLFGELDVDSFPVNQAKDGFVWDDGLEEAFINSLKTNISDYIKVAELSKKVRDNDEQYSDKNSTKLNESVQRSLNQITVNNSGEFIQRSVDSFNEISNEDKVISDFRDVISYENNSENVVEIGQPREYTVEVEGTTNEFLKIDVTWVRGNNAQWIKVSNPDEETISIVLNIEHSFFMPYSQDENFKEVLEKFSIALSLAEWAAEKGTKYPGMVYVNSINNHMNSFLTKVGEIDGEV